MDTAMDVKRIDLRKRVDKPYKQLTEKDESYGAQNKK